MAAKSKKNTVEEVPIDRVELFLQNNYKKVILVVGGLLVAFLLFYMGKQMMDSKAQMVNEQIGAVEFALTSGTGQATVEEFLAFANSKEKASDYIYLRAAEVYQITGRTDQALNTLSRVGGDFAGVADGYAYDLGSENINPSSYIGSAAQEPLWYYRAVLEADEGDKAALLAEFGEKYPENKLYDMVNRWEG
ncbi:hypothetical protein [Limisalsivibrio acetivorans]|uniref:hypothetical protein n=1 Tax=Limisalsivibrio acetivorans TaxID=1304888 RepID=UPI0003B510A5|nr:hypothetical protein [Limisalsivibrio acetivorans]